jgi:hypothetical protein
MKSLRPLFPAWRMVESFPAIVWAVGWLAVFKGILWIFIDPNFPASIENAVFMKELLLTVPFVVFGVGVWHLNRWAVWGLLATTAVEILVTLAIPGAVSFMAHDHFILYTVVLLVFIGPLGNILILLSAPTLLRTLRERK